MKTKRFLLSLTLLCAIFLQSLGAQSLTSEAAGSGKYFTSGKLYYHTISKNKVEVCGTKQTTGTLTIPSYVTHKGKKYKVTKIANHTTYNQDTPITEQTSNGSSVAVNLAGDYSYIYKRTDKKPFPANMNYLSSSNITKVILPSTLTYIGEGAFCGCNQLKTVKFAKKYKKLTIGKNAFGQNKIKSLSFPDGTYELKENAAGKARAIYIPSTVKKIGAGVVNANTKKVTISKKNKYYKMKSSVLYTKNEKTLVGVSGKAAANIKISNKTVKIGAKAFAGTKVKKVTLNKKITSIPKGVFYNCKKLVSVSGTDNLTSIRYAAFANCPKLKSIGNTSNLTTIDRAAFWGDNNLVFHIFAAIKNIDDYAFSGTVTSTALKLTVTKDHPVYSIENQLLLKKTGNKKIVIMQLADIANITVPENVTDIAIALGGNKCTSITLPSTLYSQEGQVSARGGTILYQSINVPKFGPAFDIGVSYDKVTTVIVPAKSLQAYKTTISKLIWDRDDYEIWGEDVIITGQ